jgi:oxalate decarboxylase
MKSNFFFSLESIKPQQCGQAGTMTWVTGKDVAGFFNISFVNLRLNQKSLLEPIWHSNAHKIGYCIKGKGLVSIRSPIGVEVFTVEKGEMFFIPQGYIHHIENIGQEEQEINFALSHSYPQTITLSQAVDSLSDSVFNSTFNTSPGFLNGLKNSQQAEFLIQLSTLQDVPKKMANRYKFAIEDSQKAISTKGGYLQIGVKMNLPLLQDLGILGFRLNPKGCVEPHWHTNAGELVYIVKGKTRISVLSPNGHTEVLEVKGGEGAFAPACHFHYIENIGSDDVEVIAFFSHAEPDYMGIGEVFGSYSNDLLASVFKVEPHYFDQFKKPERPLVIVPL